MPDPELPDLLTTAQLAAALGCDVKTVQRLARARRIPSYRLGADYRFDLRDVLAALRTEARARDNETRASVITEPDLDALPAKRGRRRAAAGQ